ncbi:MAG: hypothetical protein EXR89_03045 [Methylococcaceae bacterium]|nr:hypothetical protein [Methylococcaceae bacterium]
MPINNPFDSSNPVIGEASIDIDKNIHDVFSYVGEHFFENYPKWAVEVVEFQALDSSEVTVGAKAKQIRKDNGQKVESVFEITDYHPDSTLVFKGISAPYRHSYLLVCDEENKPTNLTFRFELLELDVFMRPFQKLIRFAIEEGAENTVENIKNLIAVESDVR